MSPISASRAAVFTSQSQDVEVFLEDGWRPGALLGWRHDVGGGCQVWVRVTVDGGDRETWTDLAEVRLPEGRPTPPPGAGSGPFAGLAEELLPGASAAPLLSLSEAAAREQRMAGVLPSPAPRGRRRHGGDVTAEMPAVSGGAEAGRHRASAVAGRHRAVDALPESHEGSRAELGDATVLMPRATDVDRMTRPLRLGDRVSRPRPARPERALPA